MPDNLIRETPIHIKFVNVEQWSEGNQTFTKYEQSVGSADVLVVQLKSNRSDAKDTRI